MKTFVDTTENNINISLRKAHSPHLLALEVDDGVLAPVLEAVLVGGHRVVGQQLSEPITRHVLRGMCHVSFMCHLSVQREYIRSVRNST